MLLVPSFPATFFSTDIISHFFGFVFDAAFSVYHRRCETSFAGTSRLANNLKSVFAETNVSWKKDLEIANQNVAKCDRQLNKYLGATGSMLPRAHARACVRRRLHSSFVPRLAASRHLTLPPFVL